MVWTHRQPEPNHRDPLLRRAAEAISFGGLLVLVACSAIVTKELTARTPAPALAVLDTEGIRSVSVAAQPARPRPLMPAHDPLSTVAEPASQAAFSLPEGFLADTTIRYFNGRPVKPIRQMWMTTTAYSPDARSCGDSADNITASNHHIETNAHRLVAADTRILPIGSMISVPGYDQERIVPVLDRGGAIKGMRLDLLYPTHEQARKWGVKKQLITVWGYADELPADDWRKIRDSKK